VEPTPCLILLKRRRVTAPIFSNVTRAIKMSFSNYSSTTSSLQLFISSEIISFGSRLVHNSSRTTGSNQDMLEIKKHGGKLMAMSIPVPKGLRE
jgi:t-SNARE complex subunit (syntaxin)